MERILTSPGLFWIGELIFVQHLESEEDFSNCETVCKLWREFFINANLWKSRVYSRLAKSKSYQRFILESKEDWNINIDVSQHCFYKKLAKKFTAQYILSAFEKNQFSIKKITNWPIIRDLSEIDGQRLIFAQGCNIQVATRNPYHKEKDEYGLHLIHDLVGHRREVTCLAFDSKTNQAVAGSRDRSLTLWNIDTGTLKSSAKEAHDRLITTVRIFQSSVFSSSRDRSVKVWDLTNLNSLQILEGYHGHSVWGIDVRNDFLVTSSADKSMSVWSKNSISDLWTFQTKMDNEDAPLRNVIILKRDPNLALSGDLVGDLKVWNLKVGQLSYQVPDPCQQGLFRQSGSIVSLSQSFDLIACAFSNKSIALFSAENCQEKLTCLNLIALETMLDKHGFIRNIHVCDGQVYVCNVSGKHGIIVFSVWE